MRVLGQIISVLAIAVGVGLLAAGSSASPQPGGGVVMGSWERSPSLVSFYHDLAIGLKGFGAGLLTLGILGLVVPWANVLIHGRRANASASAK